MGGLKSNAGCMWLGLIFLVSGLATLIIALCLIHVQALAEILCPIAGGCLLVECVFLALSQSNELQAEARHIAHDGVHLDGQIEIDGGFTIEHGGSAGVEVDAGANVELGVDMKMAGDVEIEVDAPVLEVEVPDVEIEIEAPAIEVDVEA